MAFVYFFIFPALFQLTLCLPWTMDLPEVRQYYFKRYGNPKNEIDFKSDKNTTENDNNTEIFNNYYSDSQYHEHNKGYMHNMDYDLPDPEGHDGEKVVLEDDLDKYAEDYEYQSYMEKKVTNIVHSGSKYLEGLRQSLEKYYSTLENCNRRNFTADQFQDQDTQTQSPNESTFNESSISFEQCRNATRKSEKIRRVTQLALHTTRLLQDRVYSNKYDEQEHFDHEDRSLILRLSWFLDKLALLTGYVPEEKNDFTTTTTRVPQSASPISVPALVTVPDDIKRAMLECLDKTSNSSEPATVRCNFPVTYNDFLRTLFDSDTSGAGDTNQRAVPADLLRSLFNNGGDLTSIPNNNAASSPGTDSQTDTETVLPSKRLQKRSIPAESPLTNILGYYAKYKAWQNANTNLKSQKETKVEFPDEIESKNSLLDKLTRDETLKSSEFPAKFFSQTKIAIDNDDQPEIQADIRKKRSTYEVNRKLPRIPEDPMQDISYYAKNKKGVSVRPNLVEAAQVRAGLEQIFQNGNIEVVRRYGSNFNPLDVATFYQGVLRSVPDIFV